MRYLYGDSTPSPLRANFIEFLRHALDFSVYVLSAEQRIAAVRERKAALEQAAADDMDRFEALHTSVLHALELELRTETDSPVARCAALIARGTADAVTNEVRKIEAALAADASRIEVDASHERESCQKALEALLLRHDLPESRSTVELELGHAGYAAQLRGTTTFGLAWTMALEIAATSPFAGDVRVDRFAEGLEIHAPESGGWIRKEIKIAPQRLGRYHIAALSVGDTETGLKLRVSPEAGASGFDVSIRAEAPRVVASKVGKDEEGASGPFDLSESDSQKLFELCGRLVASVEDLSRNRKALIEAKVDGEPFKDHRRPSEIIERLIAAMVPIVRSIDEHSLSPNELVLRRMVGEDRREEIFVSKAALAQKLVPLSASERALFTPLGLDDYVGLGGADAPGEPITTSPPPRSVTTSVPSASAVSPAPAPVAALSPPKENEGSSGVVESRKVETSLEHSIVDDQWPSPSTLQGVPAVVLSDDGPSVTIESEETPE